jgi:hypothetical protein
VQNAKERRRRRGFERLVIEPIGEPPERRCSLGLEPGETRLLRCVMAPARCRDGERRDAQKMGVAFSPGAHEIGEGDPPLDLRAPTWPGEPMSLVPVAPPELPALAAFINAAYRGRSAEQGWAHEAG